MGVWRLLRRLLWAPLPRRDSAPQMPKLPPPPYPSLSLAFDLGKQAIDHQIETADGLDVKAGFVLASASLLVAVLTVWRAPNATLHCTWPVCQEQLIPHAWIDETVYVSAWVILFAALVVYGFVIYFAGRAYALRNFNSPPRPSQFVTPYAIPGSDQPSYALLLPEEVTKLSLFGDVIKAHALNANLIEEKVQWVRRALFMFWLEAVTVGLVLMYETIIATHMS